MRNGGQWTESRFQSFVKSILRAGSQRWGPKYSCLNKAFVGRFINVKTGKLAKHYKCAICSGEFPLKDVQIDHIHPIVPIIGFDSWDAVIERLFCEEDGLQVVCKECHKSKSKEENALRKANTKNNNKV